MIESFTVYGERCSGTNYLQELMARNFDAKVTWKYGWKHFFGFQSDEELKQASGTLFICIVRDIRSWMNSLYRQKWHLATHLRQSVHSFLNSEFYSIYDETVHGSQQGKEIMEDRNIFTRQRYTSIFELREVKIRYMQEVLPTKVQNCILIRYEDLINDFETTMNLIKAKGLQVKKGISFPQNSTNYKQNRHIDFRDVKKRNVDHIPQELITSNPNLVKKCEHDLRYNDI
jgi:hypothetical protein